jgi:diacylglycerol kinase family enzyme
MSSLIAVIINVGSGEQDAQAKLSVLRDAFAANSIVPEFFLAHDVEAVFQAAEKCVAEGYKIIAAAGGDGTLNAVASKLLNTDASLGILPMGTFNHLAKDLGIPLALNEAISLLSSGRIKIIDAAEVNGKIFLNNSSIGLYPKLVRYRKEQQRAGWNKGLALVLALWAMIRLYSFTNVEINVDGERRLYSTPFVFVGNNQYEIEGLNIGSRKRLNQGKLCILITHRPNRRALLNLAWHALWGTLRQQRDFDEYLITDATINTQRQFLRVAVDGETVTLATPLKYKIITASLRVVAPNI